MLAYWNGLKRVERYGYVPADGYNWQHATNCTPHLDKIEECREALDGFIASVVYKALKKNNRDVEYVLVTLPGAWMREFRMKHDVPQRPKLVMLGDFDGPLCPAAETVHIDCTFAFVPASCLEDPTPLIIEEQFDG